MTVPLHFIRRTTAAVLTTAAVAVALQVAPASAGRGPFIVQSCYTANGQWYFKFAQEL